MITNEEKIEVALSALRCFADKCGWFDGQYDDDHKWFGGLDMDNLAARAIDLIIQGEKCYFYETYLENK